MPIEPAYRGDLAYIHDAGYGGLARDAARRLTGELADAGFREGTVVDLGCGSGILAHHMHEAGYRIVGIDVSDAMVALARMRAPESEFHVGSFVSAELPVCVAVSAIGEVLNYAFDTGNDSRARDELFGRVREALVPGGLLMFDVAGPERATGGRHRTFTAGSDWAVLVETDWDAAERVLTREITTFRQVGALYRRDTETHRLALVDQASVLHSLRSAGFQAQPIASYGALPLPDGVIGFLGRKPAA